MGNQGSGASTIEKGAKGRGKPEVTEEQFGAAALVLKCLGHPLRLRIVELLERGGELTVSQVFEALEISQAVASQHLTLMRDKGIVSRRREGSHVYYWVDDPRVLKVVDCVRTGQL